MHTRTDREHSIVGRRPRQQRTGLVHIVGALIVLLAHGCARTGGGSTSPQPIHGGQLVPPPEELYDGLFVDVQRACVFDDQKTFVDLVPNQEPNDILQAYRAGGPWQPDTLAMFVKERFTLPCQPDVRVPRTQDLREHIVGLWPLLTRRSAVVHPWSSLIALPHPYVVPGGRFSEIYYWDSYFTMLGLEASDRHDLVIAMLKNFADLIRRFEHVPNGNRNYYKSRSQPPFFSHMVELAADKEGPQIYSEYLTWLRNEHKYWMHGLDDARTAARAAGGTGAAERVVVLTDGKEEAVLNRYWDDRDIPRSESYAKDVATAREAGARGRDAKDVYRDLRAAAESGWDFGTRWFDDDLTLAGIRTTSIVPVDLNSLLYHLEKTIERACRQQRDEGCAQEFADHATKRAAGIANLLWNPRGYYADYDWRKRKPRDNVTAATLFPLFVGVSDPERAQKTARVVESSLLKRGGLATSTATSEPRQQWDAPNGWAPLQWIAVAGLNRYGESALAQEIGVRFLRRVQTVFACYHKMIEKYDVEVESDVEAIGGGGEYETQDGFGWTNGVTLQLLKTYSHAARELANACPRPIPEALVRERQREPGLGCPPAAP